MVDININSTGQGDFLINTEEDLIKQQVDILFSTKYQELFGNEYYGVDHEVFLHDMTLSNEAIAYHIQGDIEQLNLFDYDVTVSAQILEGTQNDIIIVSIIFQKGNQYFEKNYSLE